MEDIEEDHQQKGQSEKKSTEQIPHPLRKHTLPLIIISAALLLLITSGSIIGYNTLYRPYMQQVEKTAVAQARRDRNAAAHATHEAIANATAAALVAATATMRATHQDTYNQVTKVPPILSDMLRNPNTYNWDTGAGCAFTNDTYTATVTQKGFFLPCLAKHTNFGDFAYQVEMKISRGDAGGIVIRANAANTQSYLFVVDQDGTYSIYYYPGNAHQRAQTLTDGYSGYIESGLNRKNYLGVIASGTSLDFYINNKYITSVTDEHRSSGLIGVLANNYTNTTSVVYTQVKVWKL
jgi:hypothetical protein